MTVLRLLRRVFNAIDGLTESRRPNGTVDFTDTDWRDRVSGATIAATPIDGSLPCSIHAGLIRAIRPCGGTEGVPPHRMARSYLPVRRARPADLVRVVPHPHARLNAVADLIRIHHLFGQRFSHRSDRRISAARKAYDRRVARRDGGRDSRGWHAA
jgi:hypothetical protein